MAIIIKEIHVKTTVSSLIRQQNFLTEEAVSKLKQEIIKEMQRSQQIKNNWSKER